MACVLHPQTGHQFHFGGYRLAPPFARKRFLDWSSKQAAGEHRERACDEDGQSRKKKQRGKLRASEERTYAGQKIEQHGSIDRCERESAGRAGTRLDGRPAAGVWVEPGAVPPLADEALDGGVQRPALLLLHGGRLRRRRRGVRAVLPLLPRAATEQRSRRERHAEEKQQPAATASAPHRQTNGNRTTAHHSSTPRSEVRDQKNWIERSARAPLYRMRRSSSHCWLCLALGLARGAPF